MTHYVQALNASERFLDARQGTLSRLLRLFILALRVSNERRQLAVMDDARLADIGYSRADAVRESARGFLDIPESRKAALYR